MKIIKIKKSKFKKEDSTKVKQDIMNIKLIKKDNYYKSANYSDSVSTTTFEFNRNITEKEFIVWLNLNGYTVKPSSETNGWWESYSEITGSNKTWIYKWINPYTD